MEAVELRTGEHPFYVASQYHPEFKSRLERPAPLFDAFVAAALTHSQSPTSTADGELGAGVTS